MQVCFLGLQAFSTLCQSVDFVNILSAVPDAGAALFHAKKGRAAVLRITAAHQKEKIMKKHPTQL